MRVLRDLARDDAAATMVEYAIMVALIAAVCIALISTLGKRVSSAFSSVNGSL
jgi:pilus assembly protein Flp/PilA